LEVAETEVIVEIVVSAEIGEVEATAVARCLGVFRAVAAARRWALVAAGLVGLRAGLVGLQVVLVALRGDLEAALADLQVVSEVLRAVIGAADLAR
jgi:hypothetical protein